MNQEIQFLIKIIKYYLNEKKENLLEKQEVNWEKMIWYANRHNVLNYVYYYIEEYKLKECISDEMYKRLYQQSMYEITKGYNQLHAAEELLDTFEKQGVSALAVKGICAKYRYPQCDMRSMGDLDILYQSSQHQQMKKIMKQLEYKQTAEGRKHDCYILEPFVVAEMHRELVATDSKYNKYYENVWSRLKLKENHKYVYQMSLEDEYIYSLIHLVEHFQNGGVGIRFIMDVYIYNRMEGLDWKYIEKELRQLELWEFYKNISMLAKQWFGEKENELDKGFLDKLANFIILNGVFGSQKNSAALAVTKEGKNKFLLKALFPNLKNMQSMFPWLKKWPILLPYAWCLRGMRSVLYRRHNIKTQINKSKNGDENLGKELQTFFEECGL